ncbi:hypothetical protein [Georgenia subflava]|uniref:Uncharacterized protein n=1 Tax=Georgenia subflava TaxID=1622177 RepID=A0A6N7EJL8_9MICO|nr:hypothetical protein [Georgenia subflava]MPV37621.1 hypothetical protein [Georgenia subflava]
MRASIIAMRPKIVLPGGLSAAEVQEVESMTSVIRRATPDDVARSPVAWLRPDGWRPDGHSFVQLKDGQVVGAAMRCPNGLHPTRDNAWLALPAGGSSALLDALMDLGGLPLSVKARPGTWEHAAAVAAGGARYQHCPAELVITGTASLRAWCADNRAAPVVRASTWTPEDLNAAWTRLYEVVHSSWAPTAKRSTLLAEFAPMIAEELDTERTVLSLVGAELVAACFVFGTSDDPAVEAVTEALLPEHPHARRAVAACMASVLSAADGVPVMFDGHTSDPHFYPLLRALPDVRASAQTPLDLLEVTSHAR